MVSRDALGAAFGATPAEEILQVLFVDVGQVMMGLMEELSQGVPTYRLHSEIAEAMVSAVGGE